MFLYAPMALRFASQLLRFPIGKGSSLLLSCADVKLATLLSLSFLYLFPAGITGSMDGLNPRGPNPPHTKPPSRVVDLLASQLSMITLTLSIVALRLISRFFVDKNPGWDDYSIIAATVRRKRIH